MDALYDIQHCADPTTINLRYRTQFPLGTRLLKRRRRESQVSSRVYINGIDRARLHTKVNLIPVVAKWGA